MNAGYIVVALLVLVPFLLHFLHNPAKTTASLMSSVMAILIIGLPFIIVNAIYGGTPVGC